MPKDAPSWKRLLTSTAPHFRRWLKKSNIRNRCFTALADALDDLVLSTLQDRATHESFVTALPNALGRCDENIYDNPMVALAYAHIHFLERYRRFWDALTLCYVQGLLPLSEHALQVLDVGTGPAPSVYAVQDFYAAVKRFGLEAKHQRLAGLDVHVDIVEASVEMAHLFANLSETARREKGPFRARFIDFKRLDLIEERDAARARTAEEWATQTSDPFPSLHDLFRYRLVVFSNFFTPGNRESDYAEALLGTFEDMPWGGLVLAVGSSSRSYQDVYDGLSEIAGMSRVRAFRWATSTVPVQYETDEALRIKAHYTRTWKHLATFGVVPPVDYPRDAFDEAVPYRGADAFALRTFRKGPWSRPFRGRAKQRSG